MIVDSPWMTEQEAARYVRAGVDRLRSWVERGVVAASQDPDGRIHYHRVQLDNVMDFARRPGATVAVAPTERVVPAPPPAAPVAPRAAVELPYTPARTRPTRPPPRAAQPLPAEKTPR